MNNRFSQRKLSVTFLRLKLIIMRLYSLLVDLTVSREHAHTYFASCMPTHVNVGRPSQTIIFKLGDNRRARTTLVSQALSNIYDVPAIFVLALSNSVDLP